ncbi:hypothetical protein BKA70DRAFT_1536010 [Coprinopsis sp. MPI-PUGE-AT-0042]|nr:hypothetical protein BKA70DRAFT_1536010 [Coprinopsis sp. MPI-PUGE-AT-0042]
MTLSETTQAQGQAAVPFPFDSAAVTSLKISGGIWHNVQGNSITLNGLQCVYEQGWSKCPSLTAFLNSTRLSHKAGLQNLTSAPTPDSVSSLPAQFLAATTTVRNIHGLIAPHTGAVGIFKRIEPHLRDMETLVGFASTAYAACGDATVLGSTIKAAIDTRMEQCNDTLSRLHFQIAWLPYRSFPRIGYAYCVVHEWWTGNELDEIRAIRLTILQEVTAIGQWLCCLHSFWWASSQLLLGNSAFTMAGLHAFLESGPIAMLRQVVVEEVIFLEPLRSQRRSIPIHFVSSFEDIHMAITMACHGTAASRFIETRQYQLDESSTDAPVDKRDILQRIKECKEFEITIVLSRLDVFSNVCPGCNRTQSDREQLTGWIECDAQLDCDTTLDYHYKDESRPGAEARQPIHEEVNMVEELASSDVVSENTNGLLTTDAHDAKLFRRIMFQARPSDIFNRTGLENEEVATENGNGVSKTGFSLLGVTGSGKSTFINEIIGCPKAKVSDALQPVGIPVTSFLASIPPESQCPQHENSHLILVDTPGLDANESHQDTDILVQIENWISLKYGKSKKFSGIVYLHDISEKRMRHSSVLNLNRLKDLCGGNQELKLVMATTHWDMVKTDDGAHREIEILERFWKILNGRNTKMMRLEPDTWRQDAYRAIDFILGITTPSMLLRLHKK